MGLLDSPCLELVRRPLKKNNREDQKKNTNDNTFTKTKMFNISGSIVYVQIWHMDALWTNQKPQKRKWWDKVKPVSMNPPSHALMCSSARSSKTSVIPLIQIADSAYSFARSICPSLTSEVAHLPSQSWCGVWLLLKKSVLMWRGLPSSSFDWGFGGMESFPLLEIKRTCVSCFATSLSGIPVCIWYTYVFVLRVARRNPRIIK